MIPQNPKLKVHLSHEQDIDSGDLGIFGILFGGVASFFKGPSLYQASISDGVTDQDLIISDIYRAILLNRVTRELEKYSRVSGLDVIVDPTFLETEGEQAFSGKEVVPFVQYTFDLYGQTHGVSVRYQLPERF